MKFLVSNEHMVYIRRLSSDPENRIAMRDLGI